MICTWVLALFVASCCAGSIERHRRQLGADCQLANWQAHGGNEYAFFDHIKSFTAAEGICMRCHAVVASINSEDEMTFVRSLVPDDKPFWLGATDRDAEGQFVWLDGSAMSYTNWKKGEPDNLSTDEANEADCAYVNQHGLWRDNHCDLDNKRFVCKRAAAAVTTAAPVVATTPAMLTTQALTTKLMTTTVPTTQAVTMPPTTVAAPAAPAVEAAPAVDREEVDSRVHILPVFVTDRPSQPEVSPVRREEEERTSPRPQTARVFTVTDATTPPPPPPPTTAARRVVATARPTTTTRRQPTTPTPRRSIWGFIRGAVDRARGAVDKARSRFRWFGKRR